MTMSKKLPALEADVATHCREAGLKKHAKTVADTLREEGYESGAELIAAFEDMQDLVQGLTTSMKVPDFPARMLAKHIQRYRSASVSAGRPQEIRIKEESEASIVMDLSQDDSDHSDASDKTLPRPEIPFGFYKDRSPKKQIAEGHVVKVGAPAYQDYIYLVGEKEGRNLVNVDTFKVRVSLTLSPLVDFNTFCDLPSLIGGHCVLPGSSGEIFER